MDKLILEQPKPFDELDSSFELSGWVPKSWFVKEDDKRFYIDFLDIAGKTFMGNTINIEFDKTSKDNTRFWFSTVMHLNFFNASFIKNSSGRIVILLTGNFKNQEFYMPVIIKGFSHNDDAQIIEKHRELPDRILKYKEDLQTYFKKLQKIREESKYKLSPDSGNELAIEINVTDESIAQYLIKNVKLHEDVSTFLYDQAKRRREELLLNEEYKEALEWKGRSYKGIDLFNMATYIVAYSLAKWVWNHIIEDIDDSLWDKIKEVFKKIFLPATNNNDHIKHVPVIITAENGKRIVFLFDTFLTIEEAGEAFNKIQEIVRRLKPAELNKETFRPIIFNYNKSKKNWQKETRKHIKH